jgi:hypothetical protein
MKSAQKKRQKKKKEPKKMKKSIAIWKEICYNIQSDDKTDFASVTK